MAMTTTSLLPAEIEVQHGYTADEKQVQHDIEAIMLHALEIASRANRLVYHESYPLLILCFLATATSVPVTAVIHCTKKALQQLVKAGRLDEREAAWIMHVHDSTEQPVIAICLDIRLPDGTPAGGEKYVGFYPTAETMASGYNLHNSTARVEVDIGALCVVAIAHVDREAPDLLIGRKPILIRHERDELCGGKVVTTVSSCTSNELSRQVSSENLSRIDHDLVTEHLRTNKGYPIVVLLQIRHFYANGVCYKLDHTDTKAGKLYLKPIPAGEEVAAFTCANVFTHHRLATNGIYVNQGDCEQACPHPIFLGNDEWPILSQHDSTQHACVAPIRP
jgi:hypothetical protein